MNSKSIEGDLVMTQMKLAIKLAIIALTSSELASASVCNTGENEHRKLLAKCQANNLTDERSGNKFSQFDFCISREWRDGGPFGGDKIPWYFININVKDSSGNTQTFTFDSPDGRNNFRSLLDWTDLTHEDDQIDFTSHRTVYERRMGPGKIHYHEMQFDFSTGDFSLLYDRRERVNFGPWTEVLAISGSCR